MHPDRWALGFALHLELGTQTAERRRQVGDRALAHSVIAVDHDRRVCEGERGRQEADRRAGVAAVEGVARGRESSALAMDQPVLGPGGRIALDPEPDAHRLEGASHHDRVVGLEPAPEP